MNDTVIREPGYSFTLVNIDCLPTSTHFNIVMQLDDSIEQLLPYLAACLPGCTYVHGTGVINLLEDGHIVAIYPRQITVTDVSGVEEARGVCRTYFQKIMDVGASRETISPLYERRLSIGVLDIFRALPRTNCGRCESPTCMAFAARVFRREARISDCVPLLDEVEKDTVEELLQRLRANGYETLQLADS
jgi:ArsR family metal-binding transcriptional regulator